MEQVETMPVTDSARSSFSLGSVAGQTIIIDGDSRDKQLMPLLKRWLELCSVDACRGTDKQNPVFLCAYMNTPQSAHGRVIVRVETWPHWTYSNQVFTTESKESIPSKGCSWCPCQGLPLCSWEIGFVQNLDWGSSNIWSITRPNRSITLSDCLIKWRICSSC